jgi:hypothetical protein
MNMHKNNRSKGQSLGNHKVYKAIKWHKFGGHNNITNSAMSGKAKVSYEAYFNDKSNEAITSGKIPEEVEIPNLMVIDYIDMENTIVEYNSNDVFGTLARLPLSP